MLPRVLLVDDSEVFRREIVAALSREFEITEAASGREALEAVEKAAPDAILLDIRMPDMSGIEVLRELDTRPGELPILMLSAIEDIETVVACMKSGAWNYVPKSAPMKLLRASLRRAISHAGAERERLYLESRLTEERMGETGEPRLVGASEPMKLLWKDLQKVAPTEVDVLVTGETGTGKELVARELHKLSPRSSAPFVPVDLLGVPTQLLDARLFGHERGAFTGADHKRIGAIEAARGGTLFLDEIGDLSLAVQGKLLRLLQEREFQRLGSHRWTRADVRVIAATNRELDSMVKRGEFREDLYHRIDVFGISVPPLRQRTDDIPRLVEHFVMRHRGTTGKEIEGVSEDSLTRLKQHTWPGNVRELENRILAAMVRAETSEIASSDIWPAQEGQPGVTGMVSPYAEARERALREFKETYLRSALEATDGVVNAAARQSGLSPSSFRRMLRECGLSSS
jgi:DNA-binding NtrC family response regulator